MNVATANPTSKMSIQTEMALLHPGSARDIGSNELKKIKNTIEEELGSRVIRPGNRGMISTHDNRLTISSALPAPTDEAIKKMSDAVKVTQDLAAQNNLIINATPDAKDGITAKSRISLYSDNKWLTIRQGAIVKELMADAKVVFSNREDDMTDESDAAFQVKEDMNVLSLTMDANPNIVEIAAFLNVALGSEEACERTEQILEETPQGKNKWTALFIANVDAISEILPEDKVTDLSVMMSGKKAVPLIPYAA